MSNSLRTLHANFTAGELTPLLDARVDASAYQNGCRTLENFYLRPYGCACKRPGTEYGGAVKTAGDATRIIPFKRSTNTNYQLELGDGYIRVWTGGASMSQVPVVGVASWAVTTAYVIGDVRSNGGANYWCHTAHTSGGSFSATNWHAMTGTVFEMRSPYSKADIFQIQFCQINDVMFLAHPTYAPRRLSFTSATSWKMEIIAWDFAPMGDGNESSTTVTIQPHVADWVTATNYLFGSVVIDSGILYSSKAAHTSGASTRPGVGASWAASWAVTRCRGTWEASNKAFEVGEVVDFKGIKYSCVSTSTQTGPSFAPDINAGWYAFPVLSQGFRLFSSTGIFSAADVGATWRVDIGATQRGLFLTSSALAYTTYFSEPLFIQGSVLVRSNFVSPNAASIGELALQESLDGITYNNVKLWTWRNTQDGNISSTFEGAVTGAWYRLSWYAYGGTTVTQGFFMEAVSGILNNVLTLNTQNGASEFVGAFANPNMRYIPCEIMAKPTTLWYRPAFNVGAYPRAVAFHDSRLFWGGVNGQPSRIWGSRLDDFYNYLTGTDADAGIDITLAATEANQIEWLTSFQRSLVCGTIGDEWTIDSGENDAALTPTSVRARPRTRHGSQNIAPQLVADALLWVTRGGRRMSEFSYDFATDRYQAPDMTQLAEHVTAGGIVQTAFSANPDSVLWAVTGNGVLIGFTYDRAQQITAWHRHRTGERVVGGVTVYDSFESVSTIYGASGRDEVWFVVKRTVNGSTVRFIERFYPTAQNFNFDTATDLFYVDCGKKVAPSGASVTGLSHIEGRAVSVWATNGSSVNRAESGTVASGAITLGASATSAIVGLPFTSTVQPMKQEVVLPDGTGQARRWRPNRAYFRLLQSYGGKYCGSAGGVFQDIDYRTPVQMETTSTPAVTLQTSEVPCHIGTDWDGSVNFTVKHDSPTPFNLLGYILAGEVSGS